MSAESLSTPSVISLSSSVETASSALGSSALVSSADIAAEILKLHGEYANDRASEITLNDSNANDQRMDVMGWLVEVRALYDEDKEPTLNGRLVVFGLALLDEVLARKLAEDNFLEELEREYKPPIRRLLSERGKEAVQLLRLLQPTSLREVNGVDIRVYRTDKPWELSAECLVIPAGVRFGFSGGMASALRKDLNNESVWSELTKLKDEAVNLRGGTNPVRPDAPLLVELPAHIGEALLPNASNGSTGNKYFVVGATANDGEGFNAESAGKAAAEIVKQAARTHISRIALPLLGSGVGGLDSKAVAEAMVKAVLQAASGVQYGQLQQVTITTLRPEVVIDLIDKIDEYWAWVNNIRVSGLSNDLAEGDDLLGIVLEVQALSDTL
ncbi:MAG: hypothetical protein JSW55_18155, partial [Chloroflexota bacterium]